MPKSPEGGYQPTPEEKQRAEEMMSVPEQKLSEMREKLKEKHGEVIERIDILKTHRELPRGNAGFQKFWTEIDGHEVRLSAFGYGGPKKYGGQVDGVELSPEEAEGLWNKYQPALQTIYWMRGSYEEMLNEAEQERLDQKKSQIVREMLN